MMTSDATKPSDAAPSPTARYPSEVILVAVGLVAALIASHWATLATMAERWSSNPQYSHGFLVPVFAVVVLWFRRGMLQGVVWQPAWIGLPLLLMGVGTRLFAIQMDFEPLEALALLPTVFGAVLLVGGRSVMSWSWPALAFLVFMMPLPYSVEVALAVPLRRLATVMSTYSLQVLGCPAIAQGNVIYIGDIPLGVEEACSGLGMLMTFFALSTALAMIVETSMWDRCILVGSAVPIAILANVIRISATGLAIYHTGRDSQLAHLIYHDLAGWLMMPLALGLLWVELKLMSRLLVELPEDAPLPVFKR
jgi:exosortase